MCIKPHTKERRMQFAVQVVGASALTNISHKKPQLLKCRALKSVYLIENSNINISWEVQYDENFIFFSSLLAFALVGKHSILSRICGAKAVNVEKL